MDRGTECATVQDVARADRPDAASRSSARDLSVMIQEFSEDVHTGCAGAGARTSRKELPEMNEITLPMEARLRAQTMALEETAQEPIDGGSIFVSMVVPNHTASEAVEDVQRMAAGAGIALGGKLIGRCIALVGNVVLAHILGPATFGLYAIGWTITKIATVLTPLGLDSGVIRFASPDLGQNHGRVKGAITQSLRISSFPASHWARCSTFLRRGLEKTFSIGNR